MLVTPFALIGADSAVARSPVMCTMEYQPVCGILDGQKQTFGNDCGASAAGAKDVVDGACHISTRQDLISWAHSIQLTTASDVARFGPDRAITRQEAAAMMSRISTQDSFAHLRYASYPRSCNKTYKDDGDIDATLKSDIYDACALGLMSGNSGYFHPRTTLSRAEALAIVIRAVDAQSQDESRTPWYAGYMDRAESLKLLSFSQLGAMDEAMTRGEFIEWLKLLSLHTELNPQVDASQILGEWKLESYRLDDMMFAGEGKLELREDRYSAHFCNHISAPYTQENGVMTLTSPEVSTKMACIDTHLSMIESGWTLEGASYDITDDQLIITMARGGVYTFTR